jgi:serine protease AprX
MKKNTVKGFLLFGMLVFVVSVNAQSKNKYTILTAQEQKEFTAELEKLSSANKAKAKEMGFPLVIKKEDGTVKRLMEITELGDPIYYTTSNAGSALTSRANRLYPGGAAGLSLTGAGIKGGIWDGGQVRTTHNTFTSGRVVQVETDEAINLHPTHVAGTIVGNGGGVANARGIAYEGSLIAYDYDDDTSEIQSVADQIVVSCHSYGLAADGDTPVYMFGKYMAKSLLMDRITFNNPYYQPVFAAGNDRGSSVNSGKSGFDLLSQAGVSKNVITVAAIRQVSNYDAIQPSDVELADFTSFGPTDDFRIKPNIATKGVNVYSSSNTSNNAYVTESGTSMATPGITGVIMLLQQHYSNLNPSSTPDKNYMLSASVRGLISHTADEIGDDEGPDARTGWGLINAERAAAVLTAVKDNGSTVVFDERTLAEGETYSITVLADDSAKVSASISWTDPEGNAANNTTDSSTPVLVNNLDLRITKGTEVHFPWKLNTSFGNPYAVTGDNNVDNYEKVDVADATGSYVITVSHKGTLTRPRPTNNHTQDYTLIVTGVAQVNSVTKVSADDLMVWPNPASTFVNIQLADGAFANDAMITIFDIQGREVFARKAVSSVERIETASFGAGVYFVKLNNAGKQQIKKFIVK